MDFTAPVLDSADSDKASTKHMSAASTPTYSRPTGNYFRHRSYQGSPAGRHADISSKKTNFQCQACVKLRVALTKSEEKVETLVYKLQLQEEKYQFTISALEEQLAREMRMREEDSDQEVREDITVLNRMVVELQIYSAELRSENEALQLQVQVFRDLVEDKIEAEAVFRTLFAEDMLKLEATYRADIQALDCEYARCAARAKAHAADLQGVVKLAQHLFGKWQREGYAESAEEDLLAAKFEAVAHCKTSKRDY